MFTKLFRKKRRDDELPSIKQSEGKQYNSAQYAITSSPSMEYRQPTSKANSESKYSIEPPSPRSRAESDVTRVTHQLQRSSVTTNTSDDESSDDVLPVRPKEFSGPEIAPEDIIIISPIGEGKGAQGNVYLGLCYGIDVCIKELKLPEDRSGHGAIANFKNEVVLLSEISHPNVCMFYGACLEPGKWRLVTELCSKDLADLLNDKRVYLSLFDKLSLARDICAGMAWLHKCGVLHLDIKPENFLLDKYGSVKVTDFGYSRIYSATKLGIPMSNDINEGGSPLFMAPERHENKPYGPPADVYSFAIVFWQILTRKEPFLKHQLVGQLEPFLRAICKNRERPSIPNEYLFFEPLLSAAWHHDPEKRPTFEQLKEQIEYYLVDAATNDPTARDFWKRHFITKAKDIKTQKESGTARLKSRVTWREFSGPFADFMGMEREIFNQTLPESLSSIPLSSNPTLRQIHQADHDVLEQFSQMSNDAARVVGNELQRREKLLKINCLKVFLVNKEDGLITIQRFGKIMDIFGSLEDKVQLLDKIFEMMNQNWFHGDMTKEEAWELLKDKQVKSYLVRFSSTQNEFVVSTVVKKNDNQKYVVHYRVKHTPGVGFSIPDSKPYTNIFELLHENRDKFAFPQSPEGTKYNYLTKITTSRDIGYLDDRIGIVW